MKMDMEQKKAAAVAAVMACIKSEEEVLYVQSAMGDQAPSSAQAAPMVNLWGISGRQAMMQMRNMMQMKSFHGVNFR